PPPIPVKLESCCVVATFWHAAIAAFSCAFDAGAVMTVLPAVRKLWHANGGDFCPLPLPLAPRTMAPSMNPLRLSESLVPAAMHMSNPIPLWNGPVMPTAPGPVSRTVHSAPPDAAGFVGASGQPTTTLQVAFECVVTGVLLIAPTPLQVMV